MDFGCWSGLSFDALAQDSRWQQWNQQRSRAQTPAGDTMRAAQSRILSFINEVTAATAHQTVILVTHAEIIRAALLHYLHLPLDDYHRLCIDPASFSTVRFEGASIALQVNQTSPDWRQCA
jgi:probable phosphoglycerate mutase